MRAVLPHDDVILLNVFNFIVMIVSGKAAKVAKKVFLSILFGMVGAALSRCKTVSDKFSEKWWMVCAERDN